MTYYLIRRLAMMLIVIFGVITFVFLLLHLAPGDPVDFLMVSPYATEEDMEAMGAILNGQDIIMSQYQNWRNVDALLQRTQVYMGEKLKDETIF